MILRPLYRWSAIVAVLQLDFDLLLQIFARILLQPDYAPRWVDEKLRDKNTLPGFLGPMITGNMAFAMAGRKPRAGPRGQPALLASDVLAMHIL